MPFDNNTPSISPGIELMKQRSSKFSTEVGTLKGLRFSPRQSDVFVVTSPKCGTTWLQQIMHQLKTGGDMEFREITEVVPWIELAYDSHIDLEAEQKVAPRCYKTHCWYDHCPKGGKYIVVFREPCAVAYSYYKFLQGWFFQPGEVQLDEFVNNYFLAQGIPKNGMENASYYVHLLSWWKQRNDPNILFLFFEEMKEDLERAVRAVALFMGINHEEKIRNSTQMSSFEFMKANEKKFDSNLEARHRNKACGIPEDVIPSKVVTGSTSEALNVLPDVLKEAIQVKWQEVVTSVTGYETYEEFRLAFRKEKPLVY